MRISDRATMHWASARGALGLLLLFAASCLPATRVGGFATGYRQGLIDPEWDPLEPATTSFTGPRRDVDRAVARCRRAQHRQLSRSAADAQRALLVLCLGGDAGRNLEIARGHRPRTLDVVVFEQVRPTPSQPVGRLIGVVVGARGTHVEFMYPRGTRAALGVVSLDHPARRRTRDGRVENTYLRVIARDDPPGSRYLAGQLLAGFASPR